MKNGAVVPDAGTLKKLDALKTEEKGETIVRAVRYGNNIYVSVCGMDGLMSFHPPYVIPGNGGPDYMEPDAKKIKKVFDEGEVIYFNPYIKARKIGDVI